MLKDLAFLYVEDDVLSREVINIVLSRTVGVRELWIFEDSTDFLKRLIGLPSRPDIILLDINIKPITGVEMLKMLRGNSTFDDTKVIALTASVMTEEIEVLKEQGFDGLISKPIDVETFPDLLERIFRGELVWIITD